MPTTGNIEGVNIAIEGLLIDYSFSCVKVDM
jgi:hypothetical protein